MFVLVDASPSTVQNYNELNSKVLGQLNSAVDAMTFKGDEVRVCNPLHDWPLRSVCSSSHSHVQT